MDNLFTKSRRVLSNIKMATLTMARLERCVIIIIIINNNNNSNNNNNTSKQKVVVVVVVVVIKEIENIVSIQYIIQYTCIIQYQ